MCLFEMSINASFNLCFFACDIFFSFFFFQLFIESVLKIYKYPLNYDLPTHLPFTANRRLVSSRYYDLRNYRHYSVEYRGMQTGLLHSHHFLLTNVYNSILLQTITVYQLKIYCCLKLVIK